MPAWATHAHAPSWLCGMGTHACKHASQGQPLAVCDGHIQNNSQQLSQQLYQQLSQLLSL